MTNDAVTAGDRVIVTKGCAPRGFAKGVTCLVREVKALGADYSHSVRVVLVPVNGAYAGGGLLYSAPTVYQWMVRAVGSRVKALGFVVLLEGILVAVQSDLLAYAALALLVAINSVATATRLALGVKKDV